MNANAALMFVASEYDTARKDLKGRHAATEGFFKGFAEYAQVEKFYCWSAQKSEAEIFKRRIEGWGRKESVAWFPLQDPKRLKEAGCAFIPGPVIVDDAWHRRRFEDHAYSLCGVTHTTASHAVMDAFTKLLTAPVRSWDAIICPSQSILNTAKLLISDQANFLHERTGAKKFELPQLPVIPLGIDCKSYAFDAKARQSWRRKLGINDEDITLLFVGRLAFHAKAHPMPMYLAAQAAAAKTKKKIHLIQAGWFANEFLEKAFKQGASQYCPDVKCHFLDGTDKSIRREIWSAADIFVSFADSIQETFGLTPIEAMAAGLPVLVSDWDGYRETVRQSVDGFLVPTIMPPPPFGEKLSLSYQLQSLTYDLYCGLSGQFVYVDHEIASEYLIQMIENPEMRKRMGEAGLARAQNVYDWSVIIPQYQQLWAELAERRAKAVAEPVPTKYKAKNPARPDPYYLFQHYPTKVMNSKDSVRLVGNKLDLRERYEDILFSLAKEALLPFEILESLLQYLADGEEKTVGEIMATIPEEHRILSPNSILWLCKTGLLQMDIPRPSIEGANISSEKAALS